MKNRNVEHQFNGTRDQKRYTTRVLYRVPGTILFTNADMTSEE